MKNADRTPIIERLVSPLGDCLTPDVARRVLDLKPDPELVASIDEMASRHTEGKLSAEETVEYGRCVSFATFIAILKAKARQLLAKSNVP